MSLGKPCTTRTSLVHLILRTCNEMYTAVGPVSTVEVQIYLENLTQNTVSVLKSIDAVSERTVRVSACTLAVPNVLS